MVKYRLIVCLVGLFGVDDLWACASCACGDSTMTVMGTEKPFQDRLRLSVLFSQRSEQSGVPGLSEIAMTERRLELGLAYALTPRVIISSALPLVWRQAEDSALRQYETANMGDVELRARFFVYQDREYLSRHLLSLTAGMQLPTGVLARDRDAQYLPINVQLGSASYDAIAGVAYAYFAAPWSAYASAQILWPLIARMDVEWGRALLTTIALQYQLTSALTGRMRWDTRLDETNMEAGVRDPHSGGFIAFIVPEAVWRLDEDLLLTANIGLPILNFLHGVHSEGVMLQMGVVLDL